MSNILINITERQAMLFAFFLVLYEFLTYIANDMVMPGMLHVVQSFHAAPTNVASSLTMYILGGASLQIFLGPLSDSYGRRPVMLCGALLFFIFTMFIACSFSMNSFLIARFFEGMGLCFISVVGYAVLQEIMSEKEAIRLITIMSNVAILAPLSGPLLGVLFLYYGSWRLIFVFLAILSLFALWGFWKYMPESVGATQKDGKRILPMILSTSVIKSSYMQLFKNIFFMLGNLACGLLAIPCIIWIAFSPSMLVSDSGSLLKYGIWQIPIFGAYILGNILLSALINRISLLLCIIYGSVVVVIGLGLMFGVTYFYPNTFEALIPGLILYFFGYSFTSTPLNRLLLFATQVPKGTTSAVMSVFSMGMQAIGIEIMNLLYTHGNYKMFSLYSALIGLCYAFCILLLNFLREERI